ncbi:LptF/LptG family permease [Limibacter armeniacum]|uniref:LptF/LptG family permease n=1 Tax=Limibacter armeniacum TaxID=466084 RepID=UPI002FE699F3
MIKKLDKLLLKAFAGPFLLTFFIVLFIFQSQFMISKLKYLVGKGLGLEVYGELFFYFALSLVPVSLPLAVLLASLMTFGNLGQHSELSAIKASGINMLRVLRPVTLVAVLVMLCALVYNDTVVPWSNLKGYSILFEAKQKSPAMELTEGAFYDGLKGYSIKVEKKLEDGMSLEDVIIYKHNEEDGNKEVILAKSGTMESVMNDNFLLMRLFDGHAYSEQNDESKESDIQFVTNKFDTAQFFFDLAAYGMGNSKDENFSKSNAMKTREELLVDKDSLIELVGASESKILSGFESHFTYQDEISKQKNKNGAAVGLENLNQGTTEEEKILIASTAYDAASNYAKTLDNQLKGLNWRRKQLARLDVDMNKKVTSAVAILVMFLIGAPLGAIIKKGGLGVPVIISVVFFIIYYIATISGEKMAKELVLSPDIGSWISNVVLFLIGLILLVQAKNDVRLLDGDVYAVYFKRLFSKKN